ncbi:pentatricopeptide repeat-containing protein At3g58590-like [Phragmites australis]|uniref:pentatricopeptide repeat-containing protein At3g58590-like n=1 Tax=Phragmites australis TaxID=29695 RepID=UPI002D77B1D0|nr:pentatricopeptide repeat-containing protein At3g58590-like [Phragmites australis]
MPRPSSPLSASLFNSLIASRARAGRAADALSLLARMLAAGVAPTAFTFAPILSSPSLSARCAAQLHTHILKRGFLHGEPYSGTSLVGYFGRSGRFDDALKVFGEMAVRSVITWNCLISSFVQFGRAHDAVFWFRGLVRSSDGLSDGSLVAVLPVFGSPEQVHGLVKKIGMDSFSTVSNSLLNSYCACCSMHMAEKLFDELMFRDVVSWNTVITSFARSNVPERAFELFLSMQRQGVLPNEMTFASALYACTSLNGHEHGKFIHAKAIKHNLSTSVFVNTSLVDFYANCISRRDAHKVLEEIPDNSTTCWNALISGHSDSDDSTSFVILRDMLRSGIIPNEVTFSSSLKDPSLLDLWQIHSLVTRLGHGGNDYVSSAIISSYASHGIVSDALAYGVALDPDSCSVSMNVLAGVYNKARMYQETKELLLHQQGSDTISWSILITACARNGDCVEAFGFFKQMRLLGHHFDNYVFVSLLSICTKNNSLDLGKLIHGLVIKTSSGCSDTYVDNMLLDMYAKCGRIEDCLKVFEEMEDRNLISWTIVISGLGLNGFSHKALAWFKAMEKDGLKPDKVAILAVLSACRHGRLVQEGMKIFKNMKADYAIEAGMEHYICVVDMLCKCGHLKEAEVVIRGMPFRPSTVIWRTFLQGCKTYGVIETQVFR